MSAGNNIGQRFIGVFAYSWQALILVWGTSSRFTLLLALLTVVAGVLPAAVAYVSQLMVDGVLDASQQGVVSKEGLLVGESIVPFYLVWVFIVEAILVVALMSIQRGTSVLQSLFRGLLGYRVNWLILKKSQTLSLSQFEDSEFYDKLVRARREASTRPLGLVNLPCLALPCLALLGFAVLLVQFSPWIIIVLFVAALPAFVVETYFSGKAFSMFRWRSPEAREQNYLETLLAREDNAKEVKLFGLGRVFLERYQRIFNKLYQEDRLLTLGRDIWGLLMDVLAGLVFYAAFAWVIVEAVAGEISIGQMTMYLLVFKQGQSAIKAVLSAISGMYEDNLYLSNLYEFLEQPGLEFVGGVAQGAIPGDGVRFENVSFYYAGAACAALSGVTLRLRAGDSLAIVGENGSGKTTLIKLLTRLYEPSEGRILFDGTPLNEWDSAALHQQIGVIFQDFIRYQLTAGENVGVGDASRLEDEQAWRRAADKGRAADFIGSLPDQYYTQLGRWFKCGHELSGGQWQKVALARAFMREKAKVFILDEPTAAMDAQAEADIFAQFSRCMSDKVTVLISHRFSTVRTAKKIIVMDKGCIVERGSHEQLISKDGVYARLFHLQAFSDSSF